MDSGFSGSEWSFSIEAVFELRKCPIRQFMGVVQGCLVLGQAGHQYVSLHPGV